MYSIDLITATGSSLGVQPWNGGSGVFNVSGTFGGAGASLSVAAASIPQVIA